MQTSFPIDNLARVNELVASGKVEQVEGHSNLFTSPLIPGVLLFKVRTRADLARGAGCVVFHGSSGSSAVTQCSFSVDASDPVSCYDSLIEGDKVRAFVMRLADASFVPKASGVVLGKDNGSVGGSGTVSQVKYNYESVLTARPVASSRAVHAVMGVFTGATFGYGLSHVPNGPSDLLYPAYAWDIGSLGTHFESTQRRGYLFTGRVVPVAALFDQQRDILFGDMSGSLRGLAEAVLDDFIVNDWWVSKASYAIGVQQEMLSDGATTSVWTRGQRAGMIEYEQTRPQVLLIESTRDMNLGPFSLVPNGPKSYSGEWIPSNHETETGVSETPRTWNVTSSPFIVMKGKGCSLKSAPAGVDVDVWSSAMFLADADAAPAAPSGVELDGFGGFDEFFSSANYEVANLTETAPAVANAKLEMLAIDRQKLRDEWTLCSKNGVEPMLQWPNLTAAVQQLYHLVNVAIERS